MGSEHGSEQRLLEVPVLDETVTVERPSPPVEMEKCMTPCGRATSVIWNVVLIGFMIGAWMLVGYVGEAWLPAPALKGFAPVAVYLIYYLLFAVRKPELTYPACVRSSAILERCTRLRSYYFPFPVALQADVGVVFYLLRELIGRSPTYDREELTMADGGLVALDWLPSRPAKHITGPIVVICGGITADGTDLSVRSLAAAVSKRGWHACVFVRRGHGDLPLRTPRFNVFGSTSDLHAVVTHIEESVENAKIALVGMSAGSALVVRYAGEQTYPAPFHEQWERAGPDGGKSVFCGIAISPGYDIAVCMQRPSWMWRKIMRILALDFFLRSDHLPLLKASNSAAVAACHAATDVHGAIEGLAAFSGHTNWTEYLCACNPVLPITPVRDGCTPFLVLNACDDQIAVQQNVREHMSIFTESKDSPILATTARGGHVCFFDIFGGSTWLNGVSLEYIDAVHAVCIENLKPK